MVFATAEPSSCWVWIILFGSFGLGYWLRDWLSRYRRRRYAHRHDWIRQEVQAGPGREEQRKEAHDYALSQ